MAIKKEIVWRPGPLEVYFTVGEDDLVRISAIQSPSSTTKKASDLKADDSVPIFALRLTGEGNALTKSHRSMIGSYASERLKYQNHKEGETSATKTFEIRSHDDKSGITATANFSIYPGIPVIRSTVTLENTSKGNVVVTQIPSFLVGNLAGASKSWGDYTLSTATNSWFREAQWREQKLSTLGLDDYGVMELNEGHSATHASVAFSSRGSFSTSSYLPMGMLKRHDNTETWLWQIEHNGSWKWEIGDFNDRLYVGLGGPTSNDHEWRHKLSPGASFTTVPVAMSLVSGGQDQAFSALTTYRRAMRRKHQDNEKMSLIFNDYMNCLMGDPDENKVAALIDPVLKAGAEFFVIDCGWYSDDNSWWDDVGLWEPSTVRFPSGFKKLVDKVKATGMTLGLWLEPEVVGVRSVVGKQLPEDAFFQDNGSRVVEKGRYQLDFRHPAVRERLDKVVDNLVLNFGVGYFKFDYNIEVMRGTDVNTYSTGDAHLAHQRAYLSWVNGLYDRHPDLVIESCSSGAQRLEYAMLGTHSLQSTSDQQDPVRYGAISAAAPTAVTPEQSAVWAYPQPGWSDEKNALTVVNSLLGRIHLSGRLDQLSASQQDLIHGGMKVYKEIRGQLNTALPFWPIGLPSWTDDWHSLGLTTTDGDILLAVWHIKGPLTCSLPINELKGASGVSAKLLYPTNFEGKADWNEKEGTLDVQLPDVACARLYRLQKGTRVA